MNESENLLEVRGLKMHFPFHTGSFLNRKKGYIYAVDGVDLHIKKGETLGLVGESGCGKSTTLRAVAQLYKPTAGKVMLKGRDLVQLSQGELMSARKDMQIVFQDPYASLNPRMTTRDIVAEPMRIFTKAGILSMSKAEIDERVELLLERVGRRASSRTATPTNSRAASASA